MKKKKSYPYKRWLLQSPISLIVIGFGVCLISEAAMLKYSGGNAWQWISYGTLALVVFNSGICLFGDAVLWRMRYEKQEQI